MSEVNRNTSLLVLVAVLLCGAAITLVPHSASRINDLGYNSVCPFAPWSTLALLLAAGLVWVVRQYLRGR
jgi:hypothetical protein